MNYYRHSGSSTAKYVFWGLFIGGLIGAAAMYLFAPQSGEENRKQIKQKTFELRDKVTDLVNDTLEQVSQESKKLKNNVLQKADQIKKTGQEKLVEQIDRASAVLDKAKKEVEG